MISTRLATAVLGFALLLVATAAQAPAETAGVQRMIVAAGCYSLPARAYCDASAYCLDQSQAAPASGALLSEAPAPFGNAVVTVAGQAPMALKAALARHVVQIEGLGEHLSLRIRNLTHDVVEICFKSPTVVMGNGGYYTGDLKAAYDKVLRILAPAEGKPADTSQEVDSADMDKRARLQQKLWDAINDVDAKENEELSRKIFFGTLYPPETAGPPPSPPTAPANGSKCSSQEDSATVCLGR